MRNPLPPALDAELLTWESPGSGRVAYYRDPGPLDREGRPLLLLHSMNAAPSAMEMKPLFEHYRKQRPVYAPDLPGYGHSERRDRRYSPQDYAAVITDFIDGVIGAPTDVVALSTSAEFAARAAVNGASIRSLALISPTGFGLRPRPSEKTRRRLMAFFRTPALGRGLYRLLTVKPSVRYFLNMGFAGKPPAELVDYAHRTTREPGARHAPFHFLSMQLFTDNAVDTLYRHVSQPALVLYDRDPNISFDRLPELVDHSTNWRAVRIKPTLGLPHWEEPEQTTAALDSFWSAA
jgi:pimeloyl-ACP methyl ester carboxylesterase